MYACMYYVLFLSFFLSFFYYLLIPTHIHVQAYLLSPLLRHQPIARIPPLQHPFPTTITITLQEPPLSNEIWWMRIWVKELVILDYKFQQYILDFFKTEILSVSCGCRKRQQHICRRVQPLAMGPLSHSSYLSMGISSTEIKANIWISFCWFYKKR